MRSIYTIIFLLFSFITAQAQTPNWAWAKSANGSNHCSDYGNAICTDIYGNLFITGIYDGSDVVFGTDTLINNLQGQGYYNFGTYPLKTIIIYNYI